MLGVLASVLAVVYKRMKELPTMLGPAVHRGKDTTHKTLETMCNARAWHRGCNISELKQRRRRRQRERQKKKQLVYIDKTTALHVHHAFLYIS